MIKRTPADRRRSLNVLIAQTSALYLKSLQKYYHILNQKNKLLQQVNQGLQDKKNLNVWNEQLAEEGTALIEKRLQVVNFLRERIKTYQKQISEEKENINLLYKSSFEIKGNIKADFMENLDKMREEEIFRKVSLIGPHRDDLIFITNERDSKYFSSEGQQRSIIISLKIAEYEFIKEETNEEYQHTMEGTCLRT